MSAPVLTPPPLTDPTPPTEAPEVAAPAPDRAARVAAIAAVFALLVGALALPAGSLLGSEPFATLLAGSLEVREGEDWWPVSVGGTVDDGDVLRSVGGVATLEVGSGRLVLGAGSGAAVDGGRLLVERGSVLVDDTEPRTLVIDGVAATGTGAWRVDAGTRPRLATYGGTLEAGDGSATASLASYRQLTIRDRAVGGAPAVPLRYLATDRFDVVHVAEALRVDTVAAALERSLAGTYGEASREAAFYDAFVDEADAVLPAVGDLAPIVEDDRFGPPSTVLLGIAAADAVAALTDRPLDEAVERVVTLRAAGAAWGLLLLEAGGGADDLSAAAERMLDRAVTDPPPDPPPPDDAGDAADEPAVDAPPADGAEAGGTPAVDTGAGAPSGGSDPAADAPAPDGSGSSTLPTPPEPVPPPPEPVEDAVDEVGDLLDGAGDVLDGAGDVLDGADDVVDDVVDGVTGGLGSATDGVTGELGEVTRGLDSDVVGAGSPPRG